MGEKKTILLFFQHWSQNYFNSRKTSRKVKNNSKTGSKNEYGISVQKDAPNVARLEGTIRDDVVVFHGISLRQKKTSKVVIIWKKQVKLCLLVCIWSEVRSYQCTQQLYEGFTIKEQVEGNWSLAHGNEQNGFISS